MGTYDTVGGSAASPNEPDVHISKTVDRVLELLEGEGVPATINDEIVAIIESLERVAKAAQGVIDDKLDAIYSLSSNKDKPDNYYAYALQGHMRILYDELNTHKKR